MTDTVIKIGPHAARNAELMRGTQKATKVLWIDLDDTIRHGKTSTGKWVNRDDDVRVFDGVAGILAAYRKAGWRVVAVSNQGGVAMGFVALDDCRRAMDETFRQCGGQLDKIVCCVHHPEALELQMRECWCRKPKIGLLIEAGRELAGQHDEFYPPGMGLFVGDSDEDRQCAANAGVRFMDAVEWRAGGWRHALL